MQSRRQKIIKSALVGGFAGGIVFGTVGYIFSDDRVCALIPGSFDKAVEKSISQLGDNFQIVNAAKAEALKNTISNFADTASQKLKSFNFVKTSYAMDAVKSLAGKIPVAAGKIPVMGSYISKVFSLSHPLLSTLTYQVTDVAVSIAKVSLMRACAETFSSYRVVPVMCLAGMTFGAGIGALVGWMNAEDEAIPEVKIPEREKFKASMLQAQSLFNCRLEHADSPRAARTLQRSFSFSG